MHLCFRLNSSMGASDSCDYRYMSIILPVSFDAAYLSQMAC